MYTWYKNVLELIHSLIEQHFGLSIRKKSIRIKLNILINCKIARLDFTTFPDLELKPEVDLEHKLSSSSHENKDSHVHTSRSDEYTATKIQTTINTVADFVVY